VHPPLVMETLQKIKDTVTQSTVVISLAPKITLEKMASVLPTKKLVRMIPNATSCINEGFNPVSFYAEMEHKKKRKIMNLLKIPGNPLKPTKPNSKDMPLFRPCCPTISGFSGRRWKTLPSRQH
jgi:pyrroline-5-carboxylate reductase